MTDPDVPARLVEETRPTASAALDILVANAGGPPPGRALEITDDQIAAAVNANLITSVRLVREARAAGAGGPDGAGSAASPPTPIKQPIPTLALSNLARTGLWAWAKTAAADLCPDGITLNLACPGAHATDRMQDSWAAMRGQHGRPGRLRSGRGVPLLAAGRLHLGDGRQGRRRGQPRPVLTTAP